MHREGNRVHVTSSEVEEAPGRRTFALKNVAGTWIFQMPYQGEVEINDGRCWRPMASAAAEWEATVPAVVPVELYIDDGFVCTAARTGYPTALELTEVTISSP